MKKSLLLASCFLLLVAVTVHAQTFNVNLTIGSRGADVISLQQFLVTKGFLQIPSGVAYGYFGPLTRAAVARWQVANGINPPAGFFGPISRAAIATQTSAPGIVPATPTTPTLPVPNPFPVVESDTPTAPGMRAGRVMLFQAFPFEVRAGDSITLDGSGFSKTQNEVNFNGSHPVFATSTDGMTLDVLVPTNLSNGEYNLSVSNALGSSIDPDIDIVIRVTSNPQPAPIIENASIDGDTVTLLGTGFTSSNKLITTLGDSSGSIFSNGTTLTFRITDLSMYSEIRKFTLGNYQAALWIYVENEHGVNQEPYKLDINI